VPQQVEQVASTVFESVEVGATDARLRLDPAEMGEVVIHIQSDGDGGIRVEIRAERPEAAQLLRDHTQDLSQLLGDRGLNLSDVNVGLGRGNNEQGGFAQERSNNQPANGEFASILGLDEPASAARHNRLRSAYNPDGAHNYRV
jgi:flagellar hook-length control protein FliK